MFKKLFSILLTILTLFGIFTISIGGFYLINKKIIESEIIDRKIVTSEVVNIYEGDDFQLSPYIIDENGIIEDGQFNFEVSPKDAGIECGQYDGIINVTRVPDTDVSIIIRDIKYGIEHTVKVHVITDLISVSTVKPDNNDPKQMILDSEYYYSVTTLPKFYNLEELYYNKTQSQYMNIEFFDNNSINKNVFDVRVEDNKIILKSSGIGEGYIKIDIKNDTTKLDYTTFINFNISLYDKNLTSDILNFEDKTLISKEECKEIKKIVVSSNESVNFDGLKYFEELKTIVLNSKNSLDFISKEIPNVIYRVDSELLDFYSDKISSYYPLSEKEIVKNKIIPFKDNYNDAYVVFHIDDKFASGDFPNVNYFNISDNKIEDYVPLFKGYTFKKWKISNSNEDFDLSNLTNLEEGIHLNAVFEANTYKINFNILNDTINSTNVIYDKTLGECGINLNSYSVSKKGWMFDGWYKENEYLTRVTENDIYNIDSDTIVYAKYSSTVSLNYDGFDGSVNSVPVIYGEEINLPYSLSDQNGFKFSGWYTQPQGYDKTNTNNYLAKKINNNDLFLEEPNDGTLGKQNLYARWTTEVILDYGHENFKKDFKDPKDTITLVHNLTVKKSLDQYGINLPNTVNSNQTLNGNWIFDGWYTEQVKSGNFITNETLVVSYYDKLYAHYKTNITFLYNHDLTKSKVIENIYFGDELTLYNDIFGNLNYNSTSEVFDKGYNWYSWKIKTNNGYSNIEYKQDKINVTITQDIGHIGFAFCATYKVINYGVIFKHNGENIGSTTYNNDSREISLISIPLKTGYSGKWKHNNNELNNQTYYVPNTLFEDIEINLFYSPNTYKVILDDYNKNTNLEMNVTYDDYVFDTTIFPAIMDNYSLEGWYFEPELINKVIEKSTIFNVDTFSNFDNQVTLYAKFIANINIIDPIATESYEPYKSATYGKTFELPNHDVINGWTFKGWYLDSEYTNKFGEFDSVNNIYFINKYEDLREEHNYYAKYERIINLDYNHDNFVYNDGVIPSEDKLNVVYGWPLYKNNFILPTDDMLTNNKYGEYWDLNRWYYIDSGVKKEITNNTVIDNTTIHWDTIYAEYKSIISFKFDEYTSYDYEVILNEIFDFYSNDLANKFDKQNEGKTVVSWKYNSNETISLATGNSHLITLEMGKHQFIPNYEFIIYKVYLKDENNNQYKLNGQSYITYTMEKKALDDFAPEEIPGYTLNWIVKSEFLDKDIYLNNSNYYSWDIPKEILQKEFYLQINKIPNTYKITLNTYKETKEIEIKYGEKILPKIMEVFPNGLDDWKGYKHKGWFYSNSDGEVASNTLYEIAGDTTIEAIYYKEIIIKHVINELENRTILIYYGRTISLSNYFKNYQGWEFSGIFASLNYENEPINDLFGGDNIKDEYYAKWVRTINLNYDDSVFNFDNKAKIINVVYGEKLNIPTYLNDDIWTFNGWYLDNNYTKSIDLKENFKLLIDEEIILYPLFKSTITLNFSHKEIIDTKEVEVIYGMSYNFNVYENEYLNDFIHPGYIINGWKNENIIIDSSNNFNEYLINYSLGKKSLNAIYTLKNYNIYVNNSNDSIRFTVENVQSAKESSLYKYIEISTLPRGYKLLEIYISMSSYFPNPSDYNLKQYIIEEEKNIDGVNKNSISLYIPYHIWDIIYRNESKNSFDLKINITEAPKDINVSVQYNNGEDISEVYQIEFSSFYMKDELSDLLNNIINNELNYRPQGKVFSSLCINDLTINNINELKTLKVENDENHSIIVNYYDALYCNSIGEGTEDKPYIIETESQIINLSEYVNSGNPTNNKHFLQTCDISLTPNNSFIPIGNNNNKPYYVKGYFEEINLYDEIVWIDTTDYQFNGYYNGNNFSISNLTVENTSNNDSYAGLFGYIGSYGIVENLTLINANIQSRSNRSSGTKGGSHVGGFAGINSGVIRNCIVDSKSKINATAVLDNHIGGICGYMFEKGAIVYGCTSYATVGTESNCNRWSSIGGICGSSNNARIISCTNKGKIAGNVALNNSYSYYFCFHGGIAGVSASIIINCVNESNNISYSFTQSTNKPYSPFVGGICGYMHDGSGSYDSNKPTDDENLYIADLKLTNNGSSYKTAIASSTSTYTPYIGLAEQLRGGAILVEIPSNYIKVVQSSYNIPNDKDKIIYNSIYKKVTGKITVTASKIYSNNEIYLDGKLVDLITYDDLLPRNKALYKQKIEIVPGVNDEIIDEIIVNKYSIIKKINYSVVSLIILTCLISPLLNKMYHVIKKRRI